MEPNFPALVTFHRDLTGWAYVCYHPPSEVVTITFIV